MHVIKSLAVMLLLVALVAPGQAVAEPEGEILELLFVQNTTSGSLNGNSLALDNVGPTLFFTDRPQRVTGHIRTSRLVSKWDEGKDNFAKNPPNATLSVFGKDDVSSAVVELFDPVLAGQKLTYRVKLLEGNIPATFAKASLFIDRFGRGAMFLTGAIVGGAVGHSAGSSSTSTTTSPDASTVYVVDASTRPKASGQPVTSVEQKLDRLDKLAADGYITPEEYKAKKKQIIDSLK